MDCLLYKYEPELVLDEQESFYPDSAGEIVENWGNESSLWSEEGSEPYANRLLNKGASSPYSEEAAIAGPGLNGGEFHLDLSALGSTYPNALAADENDWIDERGSKEEEYVEDAQALEGKGFKDRAYARLLKVEGKIWLQYWYFYYDDNKGFAEIGEHEGDWETIEIGLGSEYKPEVVVLSQHKHRAKCLIGEMEENDEGAPIVYVGFGSHANYPTPGIYALESPVPGTDRADGEGASITPLLENLGLDTPSWVSWPGHWGGSEAEVILGEEIGSTSPPGPAFHPAWEAPDEYAEGAEECFVNLKEEFRGASKMSALASPATSSSTAVASPAILSTSLRGAHPRITYSVPGGHDGSWPRVVLSVKTKGDGLLPATRTIRRVKATNEATLPYSVNPKQRNVILLSAVYRDGHSSPVVRKVLTP